MMPLGGFDIRNLFQGHTMALLLIYVGAVLAVGIMTISFRGSVVV